MGFSYLWSQEFPIPPHALAALAALILGAVQLVSAKGTRKHRIFGYLWVLLMAGVAISAVFIHTIKAWGEFSPIHLLIPIVLISLWSGIQAARRGHIRRHQKIMRSLYFFALVVAGLFTLLPGRAMYHVIFGGGG